MVVQYPVGLIWKKLLPYRIYILKATQLKSRVALLKNGISLIYVQLIWGVEENNYFVSFCDYHFCKLYIILRFLQLDLVSKL